MSRAAVTLILFATRDAEPDPDHRTSMADLRTAVNTEAGVPLDQINPASGYRERP